eukprot:COSAG01_NODE_10979_length_2035_cov_0.933884_1_plen_44_part_10
MHSAVALCTIIQAAASRRLLQLPAAAALPTVQGSLNDARARGAW